MLRFIHHKVNVSSLLLLSLFCIAGMLSCKKDYLETDKGNIPLSLSVDKNTVVLNQKNAAANGVVFSWTSGSNRGTNSAISYTLMIDIQGNHFSNAVVEDLGTSALSRTYMVSALNDLLLTHWNITAGTTTTLEAKVVIAVSDHTTLADSSNTVAVTVTPYAPVTSTLYLIGDATPNGWSADNATPLTASPSEAGKFSWQGHLSAGDFKFITTLGQFLPSYNKGADEAHIVYRTEDSQPDEKFHISEAGVYGITVSLLDSTIAIAIADEPPYSRLWIVGDATPNGWNIDNPNEMRVDSGNLFVFHYNEVLNAGEFKFPVSTGNWGTDFYMPLSDQQDLSSTGVQLVAGGSPDFKWRITNPGPYKITLDLQNMAISIKPFTPYTQIWMVGDATPNGWNIDNPNALTQDAADPYTFTYTGAMNTGEFKFPIATGDWGTDFFMPVINGSGMGSTQMQFVPGGNPDYKWKITEAGNYKITINQLYETISIIKQ